jgi:hypothetical protein
VAKNLRPVDDLLADIDCLWDEFHFGADYWEHVQTVADIHKIGHGEDQVSGGYVDARMDGDYSVYAHPMAELRDMYVPCVDDGGCLCADERPDHRCWICDNRLWPDLMRVAGYDENTYDGMCLDCAREILPRMAPNANHVPIPNLQTPTDFTRWIAEEA